MTVGDLIIKYREEHRMSQRQFAIKCGISNGYIAMIEKNLNPATGKPPIIGMDKLKAIANALHMSVDELMRIVDGDTMVSLSGEGGDIYIPKTIESRTVSFEMDHMTPEGRKVLLDMVLAVCRKKSFFRKDDNE